MLLALPVLAGLAGCHHGASTAPVSQVRLHNDAPGWVAARVVRTDAGRETTVIRRVLGPGASQTLGPFPSPAHGSLRLVLEPTERHDFILRAPVPAGLTAYHVSRPFSLARLEMTPAAVNPEWTFAGGFLTADQQLAISRYESIDPAQRRAEVETDSAELP